MGKKKISATNPYLFGGVRFLVTFADFPQNCFKISLLKVSKKQYKNDNIFLRCLNMTYNMPQNVKLRLKLKPNIETKKKFSK